MYRRVYRLIPKLERQLRRIETDLTNSISKLPKPASEYTVKHLIRDRVLQVHKLGTQYACNHFNVKHFNIAQDFADIGKIADDAYRILTYAKRPEAAMIALTSITLAKSIKAKARQIAKEGITFVDDNSPSMWVMTAQAADPFVTTEPDQLPTLTTLLVWSTEHDALVCPICEPLDGQTWEVDDPDALTPVEDTHPNCRCRIELTTEET